MQGEKIRNEKKQDKSFRKKKNRRELLYSNGDLRKVNHSINYRTAFGSHGRYGGYDHDFAAGEAAVSGVSLVDTVYPAHQRIYGHGYRRRCGRRTLYRTEETREASKVA